MFCLDAQWKQRGPNQNKKKQTIFLVVCEKRFAIFSSLWW